MDNLKPDEAAAIVGFFRTHEADPVYQNLHDYALTGVNIRVWPESNLGDDILIEAAAFFAWLDKAGYVYGAGHNYQNNVCVTTYGQEPNLNCVWETYAEWWADPRVISKPGEFDGDKGLLGQLLCMYLNDPANERFTDCRTVADLPSAFLTAAEKAAKQ